jgi:hypothetical protein
MAMSGTGTVHPISTPDPEIMALLLQTILKYMSNQKDKESFYK